MTACHCQDVRAVSDLYPILRHRLEPVSDWVDIGTKEMAAAQKASGLSDEKLARKIPISTRTWIRWKKRGQVPIFHIDLVADVLKMEIERPERRRVPVPASRSQRSEAVPEEPSDLEVLREGYAEARAQMLDAARLLREERAQTKKTIQALVKELRGQNGPPVRTRRTA
jgi:hypothetical protein